MSEMTQSTRRIDAPMHRILEVLLDLEAYSEWTADVTRASVLERDASGAPARAILVLAAGPLRDELRLAYDVEGGRERATVSWRLLEATQIRDLHGRYELFARGAGSTDVSYLLDVDPGLPVHTALKASMQRRIIAAALDALEARVAG